MSATPTGSPLQYSPQSLGRGHKHEIFRSRSMLTDGEEHETDKNSQRERKCVDKSLCKNNSNEDSNSDDALFYRIPVSLSELLGVASTCAPIALPDKLPGTSQNSLRHGNYPYSPRSIASLAGTARHSYQSSMELPTTEAGYSTNSFLNQSLPNSARGNSCASPHQGGNGGLREHNTPRVLMQSHSSWTPKASSPWSAKDIVERRDGTARWVFESQSSAESEVYKSLVNFLDQSPRSQPLHVNSTETSEYGFSNCIAVPPSSKVQADLSPTSASNQVSYSNNFDRKTRCEFEMKCGTRNVSHILDGCSVQSDEKLMNEENKNARENDVDDASKAIILDSSKDSSDSKMQIFAEPSASQLIQGKESPVHSCSALIDTGKKNHFRENCPCEHVLEEYECSKILGDVSSKNQMDLKTINNKLCGAISWDQDELLKHSEESQDSIEGKSRLIEEGAKSLNSQVGFQKLEPKHTTSIPLIESKTALLESDGIEVDKKGRRQFTLKKNNNRNSAKIKPLVNRGHVESHRLSLELLQTQNNDESCSPSDQGAATDDFQHIKHQQVLESEISNENKFEQSRKRCEGMTEHGVQETPRDGLRDLIDPFSFPVTSPSDLNDEATTSMSVFGALKSFKADNSPSKHGNRSSSVDCINHGDSASNRSLGNQSTRLGVTRRECYVFESRCPRVDSPSNFLRNAMLNARDESNTFQRLDNLSLYDYNDKCIESKYEEITLKIIRRRGVTGLEPTRELALKVDDLIAGRYQIVDLLGQAAFSRAVKAIDLKAGNLVCLKVVNNKKDYFDQSLDEIRMLQIINGADAEDTYGVLRLLDYFYYKEHLILVTELLNSNLYEISKLSQCGGTNAQYFTLPRIQSITRQILNAVNFIHGLGIIHADLKPENILMKSFSECLIKVIDLGSSCFVTDKLMPYVQSRSYRAPEVVLGTKYDEKIDIWSIGCIVAEMASGRLLFDNWSISSLLAQIESILGPIPSSMVLRGRFSHQYFTQDGRIYERNRESGQLEILCPRKSSLARRVHGADEGMLDFLGYILQTDPAKRPSASDALQHPWMHHVY